LSSKIKTMPNGPIIEEKDRRAVEKCEGLSLIAHEAMVDLWEADQQHASDEADIR
jgi:hypothetical protein